MLKTATLKFPPGLWQNGTRYQSRQQWHRAHLMRFYRNTVMPIGGWTSQNATAMTGRPDNAFAWLDNSDNGWIAVGTEQKLYVYDDTFTRYDITPVGFTTGNADEGTFSGYGYGAYGNGLYSVPQALTGGIPLPAGSWSFDTWGEYLVAQFCGSGPIYEWQLNTASPAATITNSPTASEAIVVTSERILLAFGANDDQRRVMGSDSEDNTDWTPAVSNLSIDRNITTKSAIMTARRFRGDVLIWTADAIHTCVYVGPPYVYEFTEVGTGSSLVGRNAVAVTDDAALWMGAENFWKWDGGQLDALPCSVSDELFSDLNAAQDSKVFAVVNSAFSEVTWYYPGGASTECDSYVTYNYAEKHWTRGMLDRLCGVDRGVFPRPYLLDASGELFEHEIAGGSIGGETPYLESGPLEVGQGEKMITIHKLWPDDTALNDENPDTAASGLNIYLKAQNYPQGSVRTVGPIGNSSPQGTRITGRQIAFRVEGVSGTKRLGDYRIQYEIRGDR